MEVAVTTCVKLAQLWAQKGKLNSRGTKRKTVSRS
jgi:hypothetical protein